MERTIIRVPSVLEDVLKTDSGIQQLLLSQAVVSVEQQWASSGSADPNMSFTEPKFGQSDEYRDPKDDKDIKKLHSISSEDMPKERGQVPDTPETSSETTVGDWTFPDKKMTSSLSRNSIFPQLMSEKAIDVLSHDLPQDNDKLTTTNNVNQSF